MNDVLLLKGKFETKTPPDNLVVMRKLSKGESVSSEHIDLLLIQLKTLISFWEDHPLLDNILVDIRYKRVIPKSCRIKDLFKANCSECIVGARFIQDDISKHVFTYRFSREILKTGIERLIACKKFIDNQCKDGICKPEDIERIRKYKSRTKIEGLSKTTLISCIVDCFNVEGIGKEKSAKEIDKNALVSIYDTGMDSIELLKKIGINIPENRIMEKTTLLLFPDEMTLLNNNAPYLIAMATTDISQYTYEKIFKKHQISRTIPEPNGEPIIGVIDTLFDTKVYFSKWVEDFDLVPEDIERTDHSYEHGTMVTSIIVDGPSLNPNLDDECGRFRVKHFGVTATEKASSFTILKNIKKIVSENRDIKVWNLSLGSQQPISENFISPEAAVLDDIQSQYDVTFIVAGTNRNFTDPPSMPIGAPADSINSIVVNSVNWEGKSASYTRCGPVLSFFNKPDLCYYGGDKNHEIIAHRSQGDYGSCGTSFAAPWIARKMAYLVYKMGLNREVAKAILIDTAAGWMQKEEPSSKIGYGIVPIKMSDILHTKNDEIKFIIKGTIGSNSIYNHNIPIPIDQGKHPYVARATLCYFPKCDRRQGVDYTNAELNIQFGRVNAKGIDSINGNAQDSFEAHAVAALKEGNVRKEYRKWDNVKYVAEKGYGRLKPQKAYANGNWGIKITPKTRSISNKKEEIHFGIIITLKEIYGRNRISEFINLCSIRNWLVNHVNMENLINVYNKAEEDVTFS